MNRLPSVRSTTPNGSPLRVGLAVLVAVVALRWGAGYGRAVFWRPVPWGQWVVVHAWASLAVDPAGSGAGDGQLGQAAAVSAVRQRLAIALIELDVDVAALRTTHERLAVIALPGRATVLPGGPAVKLAAVRRSGAVDLEIGGRRFSLGVGDGLDLALVPTAAPGEWRVDPGPWRDVVVSRLEAGLPVGRLSVVNRGPQRKSGGTSRPMAAQEDVHIPQ
jgi:hypothetical protein